MLDVFQLPRPFHLLKKIPECPLLPNDTKIHSELCLFDQNNILTNNFTSIYRVIKSKSESITKVSHMSLDETVKTRSTKEIN